MKRASKTVSTCLAVLVLGFFLVAPAGALSPSIQPVIAPFERGLVSLGRLLDGVSGFGSWWTPSTDPGTVTTKCTDPEPPEEEEDDSCGSGHTQDPNGTPGDTGSGNPGG